VSRHGNDIRLEDCGSAQTASWSVLTIPTSLPTSRDSTFSLRGILYPMTTLRRRLGTSSGANAQQRSNQESSEESVDNSNEPQAQISSTASVMSDSQSEEPSQDSEVWCPPSPIPDRISSEENQRKRAPPSSTTAPVSKKKMGETSEHPIILDPISPMEISQTPATSSAKGKGRISTSLEKQQREEAHSQVRLSTWEALWFRWDESDEYRASVYERYRMQYSQWF